ncbi:MAG: aminotransferase class V-fold PLP-dependent enzyme [Arachnia sp.]
MSDALTVVDPEAADAQPRWRLDPASRHLNHGSFGAVPVAVQQEQERLRQLMQWNPVRWFISQTERVAVAREQMAQRLRVDPSRLAFVGNASAGCSVVFNSLWGTDPVDVLTTNHGYGAVTMGAQRLAARTGGRARVSEIPLGATADRVQSIVAEDMRRWRPRLLVIDQITSPTARAFPVAEICRAARELGVATLVDGAHAPGMLADPVVGEADYWVANLHKFVSAPPGAAVIVTRGDGQELFPTVDSWGARDSYPRRFDHTGTADVSAWLTAPFAWDHVEAGVGWDTLRRDCTALLDAGAAMVASSLERHVADPLVDVGQPVGLMRLLKLPPHLADTLDQANALREPFWAATGIASAFTCFEGVGYLRLSSYLYNTIADYEYLAAVGIPLLHRWSLAQAEGDR